MKSTLVFGKVGFRRCLKILVVWLPVLILWGSLAESGAAGGSKLAFVRGGNIWIANSDGTGARQLTSTGQDSSPALSPDGRWVAYTVRDGDRIAIGLVPAQGGKAKMLTLPGIAQAWSPAFTPDGKSLAVVTRFNIKKRRVDGEDQEYATHAVSLVNLKTGKVKQVVATPDHFIDAGDMYEAPAVSPDGRRIAYQESGTDVSGGFVVVNRQGKQVLRFPRDPDQDYRPFWRPTFSPHGRRMLCFSMAISEGEKTYIYLVDLNTLKATRVTQGYYPTFVDGGKAIVFERWTETGKPGPDSLKIDLWRLDLEPGAVPRLILKNASRPAGQG